jgi:proteic killer suppression protein
LSFSPLGITFKEKDATVIKSFRCKQTEKLFADQSVRRFRAFERPGRRKLLMLNAAAQLSDLLVPPGNRLEALSGDRVGQHSIRINGQWRICFEWRDNHAYEVEIADYH